jgi:hypothetical protein
VRLHNATVALARLTRATLLEGLAQTVEHRCDELGQLVEEEDAVVGECHANVP